ncbi:hypothetical protein TUM12370_18430 [Salmonella enterica subsp. enterica serovar Choleraesuis]|nr:hypothetical protein TUM12370_18430 [Salmonella enterica subsp. enterica serovar Choleraesuis]
MKGIILASVLMLTVTAPAMAAVKSCESVRDDIAHKIIGNGVPENGFTLTIVPNDEADSAPGQVVGHCANDTQKIVYQRSSDDASAANTQ